MKLAQTLLLASSMLLLGCGGSDTDSQTQSTPSQTATQEVDAEVVKIAALKLDNLSVTVHNNTYEYVSKMYNEINATLSSLDTINHTVLDVLEKNVDTLENGMKLVQSMAKPFAIDSTYSDTFAQDQNFSATQAPFVVKKPLSENFILMASSTQFFVENKTIKKYFYDAGSLSAAWSRIFNEIDKTQDLFLKIIRIDNSGNIYRVTNTLTLPSTSLQAL